MNPFPFARIAIINRGEAAVRLIHAVSELNHERGLSVQTVAFHTRSESNAMFVRMADDAVEIASDVSSPYLDYDELERALVASHAHAAWVGWGFVAEHPDFADLCERLGIVFVGPSGNVMRELGDKIGAKLLAERVGVPVAAWSGGAVDTIEDAQVHAEEIGYPLLIKATAGGGGRGIRRVDGPSDLVDAFDRARDEALKSFGDATVFMEHLVTDARHVEVQIAADRFGNAWALGVRDCSIQRRNQKIIEESASPVLTDEQNESLGKAAIDLVLEAGYSNVGTVEFLYHSPSGDFSFLEVNTRLQVEHPITELTTGIDIVKLQLDIASGRRLDDEPPVIKGHAIEARLNAEDPQAGFAPSPGRLTTLRFASGPGVRVDTGVAEGDVIPPEYDAMVAKIMAWGRTRTEAWSRLLHALEETTVVIDGGTTNKAFVIDLLNRDEVVSGTATTGWLDTLTAAGDHIPTTHAGVALLVAGIDAHHSASDYARRAFYAAATRGRPRDTHEPALEVDCRLRGQAYKMVVQRQSRTGWRFAIDGHVVRATVQAINDLESRITIGEQRYRTVSMVQGVDHLVEVNNVAHRVSRDDAGTIRAPSPSLVIAVNVEQGDEVAVGEPLVVVEAMKMETTITAPFAGVVSEVLTGPSIQVDAGTPLVRLEEASTDDDAPTGDRVDIGELVHSERADLDKIDRCLADLESIRWAVLGFDFQDEQARTLAARFQDSLEAIAQPHPSIVAASVRVLDTFADISALTRNRRIGDTTSVETHNPKEYFHQYLRSLDVESEGLPKTFCERLEAVFAHYDIDSLERTDRLERVAFRLFAAQQDAAVHEPLVSAVLDGLRGDAANAGDSAVAEKLRVTLDKFVTATEVRFPALGNAARSVRYEVFDEGLVASSRQETLQQMREHLAALRSSTGDHETHRTALLNCPEPLNILLAETDGNNAEDPLLDVMMQRLYRVKTLQDVHTETVDDRRVLSSGYHTDGELRFVVAALTNQSDLSAALRTALDHGRTLPADAPVSYELYTRWDGAVVDVAAVPDWVLGTIASLDPPVNTRRITVSGSSPEGRGYHFTFRPGADGYAEDLEIRDIHPMIAARLNLWRFANFNLERLPTPPDVYLYRAEARDNPDDVRLVALAEVRDVTPITNSAGKAIALPELERILAACTNAIRIARTRLDPRGRMQLNRLRLYVWPTVDLPLDALGPIAMRLLPLTQGIGMEEVIVMGSLMQDGESRDVVLRISLRQGTGLAFEVLPPAGDLLQPLDPYTQKALASERRGSIYPYELVNVLLRNGGTFEEHRVDAAGNLVPTDAAPGTNEAGVVCGIISTPTDRYPEGVRRVLLLGDPTKSLGSLATDECAVIVGALDLAEREDIPVDWYAVSSGARIAMDTGTENMDSISMVLRRIVEFTQDGREINIVVTGINVGAQPYWNAEATMLMHTKGILVMTPDSAMVLTGKQALDYSGGVSAEDNFGIGGYDRIMGPNGQAQYWAPDILSASELLQRHHDHAYVAPGERFPRLAVTADDLERDVRTADHDGDEFATVGEVFSDEANPGRKKPFDIRSIMKAAVDQDHLPLERWADMRDADTGVVLEAHLGGRPITMIGIASRPIQRHGLLPADGPDQWTAGTLFPLSSKKIARGINSASGSRPLVVLANLSGFDGSPESLAKLQLEFGAEIGRGIVNFDGPIVFCVVSRYHGGAFVVFSATLHDNMQVLAVEGTYASVLGGAPAAAVVFAREVAQRTNDDTRVIEARAELAAADPSEQTAIRTAVRELVASVRAEKLGEKAAEFDAVHTIERARDVGSVDAIIPAARLRPELIAAVERGIEKAVADSV